MTFAVIKTGGKQYRVAEGQTLKIEKLPTAEAGQSISFDEVLLIENDREVKIGIPKVEGAKVTATVVREGKGKKVTIVHYKAKIRYQKITGHRQPFTEVKIDSIK